MEHNHHTHDKDGGEEALALLKYMAHHNAHHAEELMEIAAAFHEAEAQLILQAVELLNQSTEKIKEAIEKSEV